MGDVGGKKVREEGAIKARVAYPGIPLPLPRCT